MNELIETVRELVDRWKYHDEPVTLEKLEIIYELVKEMEYYHDDNECVCSECDAKDDRIEKLKTILKSSREKLKQVKEILNGEA